MGYAQVGDYGVKLLLRGTPVPRRAMPDQPKPFQCNAGEGNLLGACDDAVYGGGMGEDRSKIAQLHSQCGGAGALSKPLAAIFDEALVRKLADAQMTKFTSEPLQAIALAASWRSSNVQQVGDVQLNDLAERLRTAFNF